MEIIINKNRLLANTIYHIYRYITNDGSALLLYIHGDHHDHIRSIRACVTGHG